MTGESFVPDREAMMGIDTVKEMQDGTYLTKLRGAEKQILQKLLDNSGVSAADLFREDSSELKNVVGGVQTWGNIKMGLDAQLAAGKKVSISEDGNVEIK